MKFQVLPEFADPYVSLRPMRNEDVLPWAKLVQDPRVYEHTSWTLQTTTPLLQLVFDPDSHTELSPLRFAIIAPEAGTFLGTIGFHTVSPENRSAEIAYELAPAIWGRGIATRLCAHLTKWAHERPA